MKKKRLMAWAVCICMMTCLSACAATGDEETVYTENGLIEVEYRKADLEPEWNPDDATQISFSGPMADIDGSGAKLSGNVLTISDEGDYWMTGRFAGRIVIDAGKKDKVRLILSGLTVESEDSAAIFVKKADKATLTLAGDSENTVISGAALLNEKEEELDAAVYSKADLVINGDGRLNVDSTHGHGILSKDELRLTGGTITVNAAGDGVRGRDAVQMAGGVVNVTAAANGVRSNNEEDEAAGYISIDGGELTVSAGEDGLKAETALQICGGRVNVLRSYEGMEAQRITMAGGEVEVTAEEDGLNASGGEESDHPFAAGSQQIRVTGGVLRVNAGGDGIDSNGRLIFEGGEVYVSGSVRGNNGALDASGVMTIRGGVLMACGAPEMAQAPMSDGQTVTVIEPDAVQPGGVQVSVRTAEGAVLAAFVPQKEWRNLVASVPGVKEGDVLMVYVGDSRILTVRAG